MKDILDSKMLAETVFGLNEDSFMLTVAVILFLVWGSCLVLLMVFREGKAFPSAEPDAEPLKAPHEESAAGSGAVQAITQNIPIATELGREQRAAIERVASEISPKITKVLSTVEQKAPRCAGDLVL